jgi:hypothetical protein
MSVETVEIKSLEYMFEYRKISINSYLKCNDKSVAKIAFSIKSMTVECSFEVKFVKILFIYKYNFKDFHH